MNKDFISIKDLTMAEIEDIFDLASKLKLSRKTHDKHLKGKILGLIFEKPSNRTRVSFEVGMAELGGTTVYLSSDEIKLGEREAVKDAARVLSRYLDGIVARTFSHKRLVEILSPTAKTIDALKTLTMPAGVDIKIRAT